MPGFISQLPFASCGIYSSYIIYNIDKARVITIPLEACCEELIYKALRVCSDIVNAVEIRSLFIINDEVHHHHVLNHLLSDSFLSTGMLKTQVLSLRPLVLDT